MAARIPAPAPAHAPESAPIAPAPLAPTPLDGPPAAPAGSPSAPPAWPDPGASADLRSRDVEAELPWAALEGDEGTVDATDDDAGYAFWPASGNGLDGPPTPRYMPRPQRQWPAEVAPRSEAAVASAPPASLHHSPMSEPTAYQASRFAGPGAYVPPFPNAVHQAGPAAPARTWAGHGADERLPAVDPSRGALPSKRRDAEPARLAEFVGWLSVAGAAFASVGFLLPWGQVMIGSSGVGYFDRWGLAGPAHVVVVVGLLASLALGLARTDVPVRIRTGIGGLGLGALVLGLVWPYVIGPLGSGPGAQIVGVGALALIVSGLLAIVVDRGERHGEVDRTV